MMRVDLHNHTHLCNHASGSMEEYVKRAIDLNIDVYGFSEHAPVKNFEDAYRLALDKKSLYEASVLSLKEKYKNDIKILLAYEVDFIAGDFILDEIKNANIDYLIGSVHYLKDWEFDNPAFIKEYENRDVDQIWKEYFQAVELMAKAGYFNIAGHFDLIKVFKVLPREDIRTIAMPALRAIKKANMALEINTAGIRKPVKELYPSRPLLEVALDLGIDITFSSDAHSVAQVGYKHDEALCYAKEVGFKEAVYFESREKMTFKL